jgi:integrase
VAVLREHRRQQTEERLAAGSAWNDSGGLVFTSRWGEPLYPDFVTALMTKLINQHNKSATPLRVYAHVLREHAVGVGDIFAQAVKASR